jgi:DNA-binding response OmpR family regulator
MEAFPNSERLFETIWDMKKNGYAETIEIMAKRLRMMAESKEEDDLRVLRPRVSRDKTL